MANRIIKNAEPLTQNANKLRSISVKVPGSKYLVNRYLPIAAIADSQSVLRNIPRNDDILTAIKAIEALGAKVRIDQNTVIIEPIADYSAANGEPLHIDCRDSGTLSRFVTALAANLETPVLIDASEQMRQRPMQESVDTLRQLGVRVESENGFLPLTITGPIFGGEAELDASRSSQFLSALLIAALRAKKGTRIKLSSELVSQSYVALTIKAIERFGAEIQQVATDEFLIKANQSFAGAEIDVASDVVSCSYFMAAALLGETSIRIVNYDFDSLQGETEFPQVLKAMGAGIERDGEDLIVTYQAPLKGIEVDMGNMPDAVPTLAVIAAFATGETKITNIAHLAFKESNRIDDLCEQLIKLGVACKFDNDSITIRGGSKLKAEEVSSCHDHRLAMSLALLGIKVSGLVITDAQAVEKSFPQYWQYLEQIGIVTEEVE